MKISAPAHPLANALALAAALAADDKRTKKIAGLEALQIIAEDGGAEIVGNVLDFELHHNIPATIIEPGRLALPGGKLAKLTANFPSAAEIQISDDGAVGVVACGRSRFRLPAVSPDMLPANLELGDETGRATLSRLEALRVFTAPTFAMGDEPSRYYLCGICVHGASIVATDGTRLVRLVVPACEGLAAEDDRTLIIPAPALKIAAKLLADRTVESISLRRSKTLLAIESDAHFLLSSKLIDATFPNYARVIPATPSGNGATVAREDLAQAVARLAAVSANDATIGLMWNGAEQVLRLCLSRHPDMAEDEIPATVEGSGRIAVDARFLTEQLDELTSPHVRLDPNGSPAGPLVVTPAEDDDGYLGLISPCAWPVV